VPQITEPDTPLLVALAILSLVTAFAKINLPVPGSASTLTLCYVIDFMTLLVLGSGAAMMTAASGVWSQCTFRTRQPGPAYRTWFSIGALALTVQAAGGTYAWFGGQPGLPVSFAYSGALVATAAIYFLANSVLVAGAMALSTNQSTVTVWRSSFASIWPGHLLGFSLAVVAAAGIGRSRLWLLPFTVTVLALTYGNLKAYVARFTDSVTDVLTDLPNLRYLRTHVPQELSRSRRDKAPLALMMIDVDSFKSINDTFGHHAGDLALRHVAQKLQQSVRPYDICARYAGDEFVLVLPGCGVEDAHRKMAALQKAVADLTFEPKAGVIAPLRISVGVAVFSSDGDTFEELLEVADGRMFHDKRNPADREARARFAAARGVRAATTIESVAPQAARARAS
jgi:diguanylate cyclase (GGDEF)-like protein